MKRPDVETWKSQAKAHNGNITPKMVKRLFKYVEFLEATPQSEEVNEFSGIVDAMFLLSKRLPLGPPTKTSLSVTNEPYVAFFYRTPVDTDILPSWRRWLWGYIDFIDHLFCEGEYVGRKILYWRTLPEVVLKDGIFEVYARLLISKRKPL